jgi:hypothetical protein
MLRSWTSANHPSSKHPYSSQNGGPSNGSAFEHFAIWTLASPVRFGQRRIGWSLATFVDCRTQAHEKAKPPSRHHRSELAFRTVVRCQKKVLLSVRPTILDRRLVPELSPKSNSIGFGNADLPDTSLHPNSARYSVSSCQNLHARRHLSTSTSVSPIQSKTCVARLRLG